MTNNTYCPYCGAVNESTSRFCKECGASLDLAAERSTPPPQPTYVQQPIQQQPQTVYVTQQPPRPASNNAAVASLVTGII
ncbi:MAG: zinc-ribbon domain-containing protein [Asgard group archaeon]|nr:zinc-ribbon domain-containing protein [Asgard group archaeon]